MKEITVSSGRFNKRKDLEVCATNFHRGVLLHDGMIKRDYFAH